MTASDKDFDDAINAAFENLVDDELRSFVVLTVKDTGEVRKLWALDEGQRSGVGNEDLGSMAVHLLFGMSRMSGVPPDELAARLIAYGLALDYRSEILYPEGVDA